MVLKALTLQLKAEGNETITKGVVKAWETLQSWRLGILKQEKVLSPAGIWEGHWAETGAAQAPTFCGKT